MKKILLFAVAAMMSLCVNAQGFTSMKAPRGVLQHKEVSLAPESGINAIKRNFKKTAAKEDLLKMVALSSNQRLLGHYLTDEYAGPQQGLGLPSQPGSMIAATIFDKADYQKVAGGKISKVRFAVAEPVEVSKIIIYTVDASGEPVVAATQAVPGGKAEAGWTTVSLMKPFYFPADAEGIIIGYEYTQTSTGYPISVASNYLVDAGFLLYGNLGNGVGFYDLSSYGALSLQAVVTCNSLPERDIVLSDMVLEKNIVTAGSELRFAYDISNFGKTELSSYEIDVKIDGQTVQTVTSPVLTAAPQTYVGKVVVPENIARGSHKISVEAKSANGEPLTEYTYDDKLEASFSTFMSYDVVPRQKYLIEEMTSNSCTYCPNGAYVLDMMLKKSDKLALACVHGNLQSKDPFNTTEVSKLLDFLGCTSFPSGAFDRAYQGPEYGVLAGLGYNVQYASQVADMLLEQIEASAIPSFATVNIQTEDADGKLKIKVLGQGGADAKELLAEYGLTVYVLEDGLKYRQLDNGTWEPNYIHNHVVRKIVTDINGSAINWTSNSSYENDFEVEIASDWTKDNLSVVAFISQKQPLTNPDYTAMQVTNANVKRVSDKNVDPVDPVRPEPTGNVVLSPADDLSQLMGECVSPNGKYVAGMNFATFAPTVWNTENNGMNGYTEYEEGSFHAVNNDGVAVGDNPHYAIVRKADGSIMQLYYEVGETVETEFGPITTGDAGSSAFALTADGKTYAGFYFDSAYKTYPCIWNEKGERTTLPLPSDAEAGFSVNGGEARWISADGKVIGGMLIDDMGTWPAAIWRMNESGAYECEVVSKNFWELDYQQGKPYMVFTPGAMSANGEWMSIKIQPEYDAWDFSAELPETLVGRLNLNTLDLFVFDKVANYNLEPFGISNNGDIVGVSTFARSEPGMIGRAGYLWKNGSTSGVVLDDVIANAAGLSGLDSNTPCSFTEDGKKIQGFMIVDTDIISYLLDYSDDVADVILMPAFTGNSAANGKIFSISGQQMLNAKAHGIYIINGKKVIK